VSDKLKIEHSTLTESDRKLERLHYILKAWKTENSYVKEKLDKTYNDLDISNHNLQKKTDEHDQEHNIRIELEKEVVKFEEQVGFLTATIQADAAKIEDLDKTCMKYNEEILQSSNLINDLKKEIQRELNEKTELNNDIKVLKSNAMNNNMSLTDLKLSTNNKENQ